MPTGFFSLVIINSKGAILNSPVTIGQKDICEFTLGIVKFRKFLSEKLCPLKIFRIRGSLMEKKNRNQRKKQAKSNMVTQKADTTQCLDETITSVGIVPGTRYCCPIPGCDVVWQRTQVSMPVRICQIHNVLLIKVQQQENECYQK
jgi:hypothetical protein